MKSAVLSASWERSDVGLALEALGRASGLVRSSSNAPRWARSEPPPAGWWQAAAGCLGLSIRQADCRHADLREVLAACAPALLCCEHAGESRYLAVLRARRRRLVVVAPTQEQIELPLAEVRAAAAHAAEAEPSQRLTTWLAALGLPARRARRAHQQLLRWHLAERRIAGVWLLGADPGQSFRRELREHGASRQLTWSLGLAVAQVLFQVGGFALLGPTLFTGVREPAWIWAWLLSVGCGVCLQLGSIWWGGRAVHDAALLLKRRLLWGALRIPLDQLRSSGSGRLMAMVAESERLENTGIGAAFAVLVALLQLVSALPILLLGLQPWLMPALLLLWCAGLTQRLRAVWRSETESIRQRFGLSSTFVQNLLGHRTRAVQQSPEKWHEREDRELSEYARSGAKVDALEAGVVACAARGWLLLSFAGLAPALLQAPDAVALALSIGGILQAYTAIGVLAANAVSMLSLGAVWTEIAELFHAASTPAASGQAEAMAGNVGRPAAPTGSVLLEARGLSYGYQPGGRRVLQGCDLTLRAGDRVLLEGESGGGKSTLGSLLSGVRRPDSGQISSRGLDRATLGAALWRERVASVPQFHENHLLSASLAFNLLLARAWPPAPEDLREAERICDALGLGALLKRMPAGLHQIVGDTGWQLSHGERSRVFLARALLQDPDVLIVDESFGALDPETLSLSLNCVLQRARSLIVITHP